MLKKKTVSRKQMAPRRLRNKRAGTKQGGLGRLFCDLLKLIRLLVLVLGPGRKGQSGIRQVQMQHGDAAFRRRDSNFIVDKTVVKIGRSGIMSATGKIDLFKSGPVNRA